MIEQIQWLGNASFLIKSPSNTASPALYINPWRVTRADHPADVILITSDRFDRCSLADIAKLRDQHTLVIANERAAEQIENCTVLRPWQSLSFDRMCVKAVPAYDPRSHADAGLGFIISMQFYDVYYAGDSGLIPEMERIRPDIALLPINGSGSLTPSEAVQAANTMGARHLIPYNWGTNGATRMEAMSIVRELEGKIDTVLLTPTK